MALSVSPNGGNGLANLLRQTRQAKLADDAAASTGDAGTTVSLRPLNRAGIDSTGSGTAQISAALTVYLSKLGGSEDGSKPSESQVKAASGASPGARSSAADLLRALDAYGTSDGFGRLSA